MMNDRPPRGLFCNRTLNMRRIQAVGYDMDYTLVHYHMKAWEQRAFEYIKDRLASHGWPVDALRFDPDLVVRGLIIDAQLGNVIKADRFGYVKYAFHGTRPLELEEKKEAYQHTIVDLSEGRWHFLNTLFSISEAGMYMQLVDLLDEDRIHVPGYAELYRLVKQTLDQAHMEGQMKNEIIEHPEAFVDLDERMPLTLLDQKEAGKRILLITNSEWRFASAMLSYAIDRFLPGSMTWKDLFDITIVGARKPAFFSSRTPAFEVVSDDGLLREHVGPLQLGKMYVGANAMLVEQSLNLTGENILYVGDHLFADVNVSKSVLRWRTALVIRELEEELKAIAGFATSESVLSDQMKVKEALEATNSRIRLQLQRLKKGYAVNGTWSVSELSTELESIRRRLAEIDTEISPLAQRSGELLNRNWGLLMRTGKDKSLFARQVERYADIYMTRVSDFLEHTPFVYLRSHRGSLPHDTTDVIRSLQPDELH
jgi:HAD superfamily 5'-nucleotidase-like hydrolase